IDEHRWRPTAAPGSELDPSRLVRRQEPEGLRINRALSLEDLTMPVRRPVPQSASTRPAKRAMARSDPLRRRPTISEAGRSRRIMIVLLALGAAALLGTALWGFVWVPQFGESDLGRQSTGALEPPAKSPSAKKSGGSNDPVIPRPPVPD